MTVYGGNYQGWDDWKPTYLPNDKCKFWVEASDSSNFLLTGSKVDTWLDQSIYGNNFAQTASNEQPTWDGDSVSFDETPNTYLTCNMSFTNLTEWEYYRVSQGNPAKAHYYPMYNISGGKSMRDYHSRSSPDTLRFYLTSQYCSPYPDAGAAGHETKGITQSVINDDENFSQWNGAYSNYSSLPADTGLYLDGTTYMNGINSGVTFYIFNMWEVIITARLTTKERSAMMHYLRIKHNTI